MQELGIVKWYSIAKGYGFIRREDDTGRSRDAAPDSCGEDADIFVHHSEIAGDTLKEGERVRFELVSSPKGLKARNVTLASDSGS